MYEDSPAEDVHDHLAEAVFGEHPLGRPIIGTRRRCAPRPCRRSRAYHGAHYVNPGIVVAAAGHVDHERVVALATQPLRRSDPGSRRARARLDVPEPAPRRPLHAARTPSSTTSASAGPGRDAPTTTASRPVVARHPPRRLLELAALPGGAREARPGLLGLLLHVAVRRHRHDGGVRRLPRRGRGEALRVILDELGGLEDEITEAAVDRVPATTSRGRRCCAWRARAAACSRLGRSVLMDLPVLSARRHARAHRRRHDRGRARRRAALLGPADVVDGVHRARRRPVPRRGRRIRVGGR